MRRIAALAGTALLGGLLAVATTDPGRAAPGELGPQVEPVETQTETGRFPVFDASGAPAGEARWRLTDAGGNCCEVYVASTPSGRLLEFGGKTLHYSDDRGVTWFEVTTPAESLTGEGAVTVAPNGDILGVNWTSWTADRIQAFKYDAAAKTWAVSEVTLKHPFSDRPWITTVPGPFTRADGTTAPYATVFRANYLSTLYDLFYVSLDGLTYLPSTDEAVQATGPLVTGYLEPATAAGLDYLQPHPLMRVTPLPRGGFLNVTASRGLASCPSTRFGLDQQWTCAAMPGHTYAPGLRVDSRGWLHEVVQESSGTFRYRQSTDGGRTWASLDLTFPEGGGVFNPLLLDYKVNGALGIAAVAVHPDIGGVSRDVVFRIDTSSGTPRLVETLYVGAGDRKSVVGGQLVDHRFDFASVAILPDGALAVAFDDSGGAEPRLAVELPEGRVLPTPSAPATSPAPPASPDVTVAPTTAPPPTVEPVPTTAGPATPEPTAPAPTTPAPTTPAPTSDVPTSAPPPSDTRAPAASAVLPARVTGAVTVLFDEPVGGVTAANVGLRLANGSSVPATSRCRSAAASCSSGVTEVELRPVSALRPGERYVVAVAPPGTAPPRDPAGNAVVPVRFGFRASTVEEQSSPAARWSWRTVRHVSAAGGSYAVERRGGATATYAFRGTSVTWVGAAGPGQGVVDVYVDGVRRATVDTASRTARWRVARTVRGLADGAHVLALRVRGNGPVVVDDVPGATQTEASWATAPQPAFSGRTAALADGGEVTFAFRGTGVTWVTAAGPGMGRAAVYVDGRLWGTFDNSAPVRRYDVRRAVTGLADGVHRVTVRALGPSIVVDRWLVR